MAMNTDSELAQWRYEAGKFLAYLGIEDVNTTTFAFFSGFVLGQLQRCRETMEANDPVNAREIFGEQPRIENLPASELLAACKAQHEAIDRLFAMLIEATKDQKPHGFYPSESGQPWDAIKQGNAAIAKAEGRGG